MTDSTQHQGPDQLYPSDTYVAWKLDQAVKLRADDKEIASNPPVSVVTTFKEVAQKYPDRIALVDAYNDIEDIYNYKRYYESTIHVAKAFIKLGLESSHGVGLVGFNSPQWFISYLGTIFAGGVTAGFHKKNFGKYVLHLAVRANCNIIIVEDDNLLQSALEMADDLPHLKAIIQYRGQPKQCSIKVYSWSEIMNMDVDDCEDELKRRIMSIAPNKCCSLITSSGTTGKQKWIMYSHDNILWSLNSLMTFINEKETYPPDTIVSFNDLCSPTSIVADIYWPLMCNGGTVHFCKKGALERSLVETLIKARPTVFVGYPYIYELIMNAFLDSEMDNNLINILKTNSSSSWVAKQSLENYSYKVDGTAKFKPINCDHLNKMAARIGLERCRFATVGGKTCKQGLLEFFWSLGIPLMQLYALAETACITTNLKSSFKVDSAGHVIPGIHTKLQPVFDGENTEICLFGRNLFMGYLCDEQYSKKAFDEKMWFHTSDLGCFDDNGMLTLIGRMTDFIVQRDNIKILPMPIEKWVLEQMPFLSHCVVVGENKPFLNALLVFKTKSDPESGEPTDFLDQAALDWCRKLGLHTVKLSDLANLKDARIAEEIQKVIDRTNKEINGKWELIHKWKILPREFSVTGGELGPTKKLKRNVINQMYEKEIAEFYN